jgi:hypothetical protein
VLVGIVSARTSTPSRANSVSPLDDSHQILAPRVAGREPDLATGPRHRLEQHDIVPSLGTDPEPLPDRRPTADHHDTSATGGDGMSWGMVCSPRLPRCGCTTPRLIVDAIEAVRRADARPDRVLDAEFDLADEVRLGHLSAVIPTMSTRPSLIACAL